MDIVEVSLERCSYNKSFVFDELWWLDNFYFVHGTREQKKRIIRDEELYRTQTLQKQEQKPNHIVTDDDRTGVLRKDWIGTFVSATIFWLSTRHKRCELSASVLGEIYVNIKWNNTDYERFDTHFRKQINSTQQNTHNKT